MTDALLDASAWIALACAMLAIVIVAVAARHAWQQWRRVRVVQRAAQALVGVHLDRLDEAIELADRQTGTIADGGERLAESLAQLRADADHLRWLFAQVPDERERLRHAIGDLLLPTDRPRPDAEARDGS